MTVLAENAARTASNAAASDSWPLAMAAADWSAQAPLSLARKLNRRIGGQSHRTFKEKGRGGGRGERRRSCAQITGRC